MTFTTQGFLMVTSMFISILVTRNLGVEGRGALAWALSYAGLGYILIILGTSASTRKYVAKYPDKANIYLLTNFAVLMCGALLFLPAFFYFGTHSLFAQQHQKLFVLTILYVPCLAIASIMSDALAGLGRGLHYNKLLILERGLYFIAAILLIASDHVSTRNILLITMAALLCRIVIATKYLRQHVRRMISVAEMRQAFVHMRKLLLSMYVNGLAMNLTGSLLTLSMGMGLSSSHTELGYYATARILPDAMLVLVTALSAHAMPRIMKETTIGGIQRAQSHILFLALAGLFLGGAVLFVFSEWIIHLLFGEAFLLSAACMRALIPGAIALGMMIVTQEMLSSQNNELLPMWCSITAATIAASGIMLFHDGLDALTTSYIYSATYMTGCALAITLLIYTRRKARRAAAA